MIAIRTGLRIRWPPAAQQAPDIHNSLSPTTVLTHVTQTLAQADVCVDAFVEYSPDTPDENSAIICLPTNTAAASAALRKVGLQVEEVPLVLAWLPDTMLSLACACEVIETANVHITLACLIQKESGQGQQVAFFCDDADLADRLLWALSY